MLKSFMKSPGRFTNKEHEVDIKKFEKINAEFEKKRAEYEKFKDQPAPHEDPLSKINTERPGDKDAPILNHADPFPKAV